MVNHQSVSNFAYFYFLCLQMICDSAKISDTNGKSAEPQAASAGSRVAFGIYAIPGSKAICAICSNICVSTFQFYSK